MTKKEDSPTNKKEETKTEPSDSQATKDSSTKSTGLQTIIITVLSTALICFLITFIALVCTGAISFGNPGSGQPSFVRTSDSDDNDRRGDWDGKKDDDKSGDKKTSRDDLVDNPNPRVKANGNLVEVKNLEFYLPSKFEAGGKNKDGAYTYNLVNDDGWAQVLVYVDSTSLSPTQYLNKVSSYLDINDDLYEVNGTKWVEAENGTSLAYSTKVGGKNYVVYYAVKLDSDATSEAMSMIPKTLYMKKIEQD